MMPLYLNKNCIEQSRSFPNVGSRLISGGCVCHCTSECRLIMKLAEATEFQIESE